MCICVYGYIFPTETSHEDRPESIMQMKYIHVRICTYMCVCIYVYIYTHIYICMNMCRLYANDIYTRAYIYIHVYMYIHIYIYMYIYM